MINELKSLIAAATEAGSENTVSPDQIHSWLAEYLQMYQEDEARFPELSGKPHGDVLVADFDKSHHAMFVAAVFKGDDVVMAAGRADSVLIREFLEREVPPVAGGLILALATRFIVADYRITTNRHGLDRWLDAAD